MAKRKSEKYTKQKMNKEKQVYLGSYCQYYKEYEVNGSVENIHRREAEEHHARQSTRTQERHQVILPMKFNQAKVSTFCSRTVRRRLFQMGNIRKVLIRKRI